MSFRTASGLFGIVPESTPYTFQEPAGANCFPVFDVKWEPDQAPYKRKDMQDDFGKLDDVPGPKWGKLSFGFVLVGSGSAGVASHLSNILKACGLQETVVASTSVTYTLAKTFDGASGRPAAAYSSAFYRDNGVRYSLAGCQGNLKISTKSGSALEGMVELQGAYIAPVDDTAPTPSGVSLLTPPTFLNAGLTMHSSFVPVFDSFMVDLGNKLGRKVDANNPNGVKGFQIVDRMPIGEVDPEMEAISAHDFFGRWASGATGVIQTGVLGSSAGNRIQVVCNRTQYTGPKLEDREGYEIVKCPFSILKTAGGLESNAFSLIFT